MNILLLVHCAPATHSAALAFGCANQAVLSGHRVEVFFDADGVWHTQAPAALDAGLDDLHQAYAQLVAKHDDLRLLVCRAALSRRHAQALPDGWHASGLTELAGHIEQADRVLTFSA